jgi:hypothetical protein
MVSCNAGPQLIPATAAFRRNQVFELRGGRALSTFTSRLLKRQLKHLLDFGLLSAETSLQNEEKSWWKNSSLAAPANSWEIMD